MPIHREGRKHRIVVTATVSIIALGFIGARHLPAREKPATPPTVIASDWPVYGGSPQDMRYSPLTQINRNSVAQLKVAWSYDSGESGGLQTSPLMVDGVVYAYTPTQKVIALDAATGKLLWKFDSGIEARQPDRGLATWTDGQHRRILADIMNYVYALDARTGKAIKSFGTGGRIDLREGLGRDPHSLMIALTSPGIVYKDLLIVGGREPESLPCAPGDIRAYDVRSGALRWSFHTIPHPGEFGYETWPAEAWTYSGAANNWAGMALDPERGIVYVPTGSAAADFYGANRAGDDLFANCLLALDAATGKRLWHFQAVRHDLWDRDFPSPPVLVTVYRDGKPIDAVAQTSKQGFVFLFDRTNGKPLFPIESRTLSCESGGRRSCRSHPTAAHTSRAVCPAALYRGHGDEPNPGGSRVGARAVSQDAKRRPICAVRSRAGYRGLSWLRRWRGMGRSGSGPRNPNHLRQLKRYCRHRRAGGELSEGHHRPARLYEPVRRLPS